MRSIAVMVKTVKAVMSLRMSFISGGVLVWFGWFVALAIWRQWQMIDPLQYLFYVFLKYFHFSLFYMG
jgi:prepilin signal peptidase PulO-like enzyme (type II secretory pathway)